MGLDFIRYFEGLALAYHAKVVVLVIQESGYQGEIWETGRTSEDDYVNCFNYFII